MLWLFLSSCVVLKYILFVLLLSMQGLAFVLVLHSFGSWHPVLVGAFLAKHIFVVLIIDIANYPSFLPHQQIIMGYQFFICHFSLINHMLHVCP